jgi:hypothetical protein
MTFSNATIGSILGQAAGDAFGHSLAAIGGKHEPHLSKRRYPMSKKRQDFTSGLHTYPTQEAMALVKSWTELDRPLEAPLFCQHAHAVLQALHPTEGGTALRAVPGDYSHPWGRVSREMELEPTLRIGPVSTLLPSIESLIPWAITLTQQSHTNPVTLAGVAQYAAICWGYSHGLSPEDSMAHIQRWRQSTAGLQCPIPDQVWWQYEQSLVIMGAHGEAPMLEFISQVLQLKNPLVEPSPSNILSILPILIHHSRQGAFVSLLSKALKLPIPHGLSASLMGCLGGARLSSTGIPFWMRVGLVGKEELETPNGWSPEQEKEWTDAPPQKAHPLKRRKKKDPGKNKQLPLF